MKVLIRLGNGKYYTSKVFAIFNNKIADRLNRAYSYKYLVFNEDGSNFVLKDEYEQNSKQINALLLIMDNDTSDMELDENGLGKVNFISQEDIDDIILNEYGNVRVIEECKKYVELYNGEYIYIKNERDIENLMYVSGGFHDGYIKSIERNGQNELVVLFDDLWGCNIEIIFSSDVEYKNRRNIDDGDVWWFSCTLVFDNEKIIFVDEEGYEFGESLENYSTWFKAKEMKYRIIPR